MLAFLKIILRISNAAYDDEISMNWNAAVTNLKLAGIIDSKFAIDGDGKYTDQLILQAVTSYVKGSFGWNNVDSEKAMNAFESLKHFMTLTEEYTVEPTP